MYYVLIDGELDQDAALEARTQIYPLPDSELYLRMGHETTQR